MFLEAYFDESERESGDFCVAGYAFTHVQAMNFSRDWLRMLGGIRCFHTTDLLARREEFKDFKQDDVDRTLKRAVAIINERTVAAVAVICNRKEFEAVAPTLKRGFRNPYPVCCHLCMSLLGKWMDARSPGKGNIAYFFESGNRYAGEANDLLSLAKRPDGISAGLADFYRYRSHAFVDKRDAPPLQAADLLAWEWTKVKDETLDRKVRPVRRSLRALMNRNPANFLERHLTGAALRTYCEKISAMDLGI